MNKKIVILVVLMLLLAAGIAVWRQRPVPVSMRLDLTGTPGLQVAGTVVVDGVSQEFSGELPANFTATAKSFAYTIWMQAPQGELRGELSVADGVYGSSTTADDFRGVRGGYWQTWFSRSGMFTTVKKEE